MFSVVTGLGFPVDAGTSSVFVVSLLPPPALYCAMMSSSIMVSSSASVVIDLDVVVDDSAFLLLTAVIFLGAGDGLEMERGTKGKSDSGTGLFMRMLGHN